VRGVGHNTVATVGGQGSQFVLRCQPCVVMAAACCDDDERLIGKVNKGRGLPHRCRSLKEFVEKAFDIAGGGAPCARLVAGSWGQSALGELTDQTGRTEVSHGGQQR
jgi:hypothetical protein